MQEAPKFNGKSQSSKSRGRQGGGSFTKPQDRFGSPTKNIPVNPINRTSSKGPQKPVSSKSPMNIPIAPRAASSSARQVSSPSQQNSFYGGGSGGGVMPYSDGGIGGGGGVTPEPVVTAPSEEDYLKGDAGFQAQQSALAAALQRYLADDKASRDKYSLDYGNSLRDLGYDEGSKAWNWNDQLTASGRGYQNQLNDFASRGMLQSQGYADAYNELQRMLGQQYDALSGAKTTYMSDLDAQLANYKGENTSNLQTARAEALQRRAAQYAL